MSVRVGILAAVAIAAVALAAISALTSAPSRGPAQTPLKTSRPAASRTPTPPALPRAALNRQDRVSSAHAVRESEALDGRPLLNELPLELGPTAIRLVGLNRHGRAVLEVDGPDQRTAKAAYRQALRALGDSGTGYAVRWPAVARPPVPTTPTAAVARVAVAYALAARNWSARTLLAGWRQQRQLATGRYGRALERARPDRARVAQLNAERASSIAVLAAPPLIRRRARRSYVTVALHERAANGGAVTTTRTRNRVALRRTGTGWRVTGWTILPARRRAGR